MAEIAKSKVTEKTTLGGFVSSIAMLAGLHFGVPPEVGAAFGSILAYLIPNYGR
jgi:hypothetical protein